MPDDRLQKRREKWTDFLNRGACKTIVLVHYTDSHFPPRPWPYRELRKERVEWAARNYFRQSETTEWLDDDALPYAAPYTGTEIFAESLGCKVYCSGDNMPFALPCIQEAAQIKNIKRPRIEDSSLYEIFELAYALRGKVGAEALIQLPDIQSPVDIAALVWQKERFLMAMLDDPPAVHELISITERLLTDFLDLWFREFGTKYIAHYPDYYMEGGFTFSEDEAGEFSADLFREFCLPSINRLSDRYGGCAMHCCAYAKHQWECFKEIRGLKLLNLCQPADVLTDAVNFFGADVCHWHIPGNINQNEFYKWTEACTAEAPIVLEAWAATRDEAIELSRRLKMM